MHQPGRLADKILPFEELRKVVSARQAAGQTIVFTNGCFDILHAGHVDLLEDAACEGDVLVVALNSDASVRELKGEGRPLNSEVDRAFALASLRCVDAAFIFRGPRLADEITALKPDLYTKAGDYTLATIDASERAALLAAGVDIRFLPFVAGHSTTAHLQRLVGG